MEFLWILYIERQFKRFNVIFREWKDYPKNGRGNEKVHNNAFDMQTSKYIMYSHILWNFCDSFICMSSRFFSVHIQFQVIHPYSISFKTFAKFFTLNSFLRKISLLSWDFRVYMVFCVNGIHVLENNKKTISYIFWLSFTHIISSNQYTDESNTYHSSHFITKT